MGAVVVFAVLDFDFGRKGEVEDGDLDYFVPPPCWAR